MSGEHRSRSNLSLRSNKHPMGHKKVHSLPPMSKGHHLSSHSNPGSGHHHSARSQSLSLQEPDRQRIIGSPAPQAFREINEKHHRNRNNKRGKGDFPTITLSAAESEEGSDDEYGGIQRDSVISVGQVGGGARSRQGSSRSRSDSFSDSLALYSLKSLGSVVEQQRAQSGSSRIGLTPPPRVISLTDRNGCEIVTEWNQDMQHRQSQEDIHNITEDGKERSAKSKSNLPSLGKGPVSEIPSKYPPLEPIKVRRRVRRSNHK